jgi:hypothetical protein
MVHFAGYHPAARYIPVDEYCCGAAYTPPWTNAFRRKYQIGCAANT